MTVSKLIEELAQYDKDSPVKLHDFRGEPVLFVVAKEGDDSVWLETESDNDMVSELSARFEHAILTGEDELDFYMDLLERGCDVPMVRKYLGDEAADHMKKFCEEHGLI